MNVQDLVVSLSILCIFSKVCASYTLQVLTFPRWRDLEYWKQESTCALHIEGTEIKVSQHTNWSPINIRIRLCAGRSEWTIAMKNDRAQRRWAWQLQIQFRWHLRAMRELHKLRNMRSLVSLRFSRDFHIIHKNSLDDSYSRTKSTLEVLTLHY